MKIFKFEEVVADDRHRLADEIETERINAVQEVVEYQLAELRKLKGLTQAELARHIELSQPAISKLEGHGAEKISTLRAYVEALGGHLEISAVFDDYKVVLRVADEDEVSAARAT